MNDDQLTLTTAIYSKILKQGRAFYQLSKYGDD